jgi:uncharacterized membrane protein
MRAWRPLWAWIVVPLVLVVLLGVVAGAVWWRWDTARQPTVADAVPAMRRAVAEAVVAAGPTAVVAVSRVVRSSVCRLNALRDGGVFTAKVDVYTGPGAEEALVDQVEQRLAGRYPARRGAASSGVRPLEADAGPGVLLAVRRVDAGWLTISARTGCSLGTAPPPATPPATGTGAAAITTAFAALGTRPASFVEHRLDCPSGQIVTVAAVSEPADSSALAQRLSAVVPPGARRVPAGASNRVTYREGPVSVVVAASDDGTTVTAQHTVGC